MKFAVIFTIAMACAMAAPSTPNAGQSETILASTVSNDSDGIFKRSPAPVVGNQKAKTIVRRRPVTVINGNGKLVDFDDDDVKFVTSGFNGRQVAIQTQQASVSQTPIRSSTLSSVSSLRQTPSNIVFINDSGEIDNIDDLDDLGDLAIISPTTLNTFPFLNRQTPARVVSQSSFFNPSTSFVRAPVRQTGMKTRFMQSNNPTTCSCPPQQRQPIFQFSRVPQQSVNRFSQFGRFPQFASSSGVQFVFDD